MNVLFRLLSKPIKALVRRVTGPLASRIAAAVGAGIIAALTSMGLEVSPEVIEAGEALTMALTTILSFAFYGWAHNWIAGKKDPPDDQERKVERP